MVGHPAGAQEKRPLLRWEEYQRRRASEGVVRRWFACWPDANIGVVTGSISGLVVLDVDPGHGGGESLARLEAIHGPLPFTVSAVTGGGGRHVYFRHPDGEVRNRVGIAPGLDLRGDGGYVVAPPSVHPSGRPYAWEPSGSPDEAALAPIPAWLLQTVEEDGAHPGHSLHYWRSMIREGVAEGARNNTIASLAGHLLWHDVDPAIVLDLLLLECRKVPSAPFRRRGRADRSEHHAHPFPPPVDREGLAPSPGLSRRTRPAPRPGCLRCGRCSAAKSGRAPAARRSAAGRERRRARTHKPVTGATAGEPRRSLSMFCASRSGAAYQRDFYCATLDDNLEGLRQSHFWDRHKKPAERITSAPEL